MNECISIEHLPVMGTWYMNINPLAENQLNIMIFDSLVRLIERTQTAEIQIHRLLNDYYVFYQTEVGEN